MERTVRAACPQCKTVLRIPADWVGRTMRCKSCGAAVRIRPRREAGAGESVPTSGPPAAYPLPPGYAPPSGLPVHVLPAVDGLQPVPLALNDEFTADAEP